MLYIVHPHLVQPTTCSKEKIAPNKFTLNEPNYNFLKSHCCDGHIIENCTKWKNQNLYQIRTNAKFAQMIYYTYFDYQKNFNSNTYPYKN